MDFLTIIFSRNYGNGVNLLLTVTDGSLYQNCTRRGRENVVFKVSKQISMKKTQLSVKIILYLQFQL